MLGCPTDWCQVVGRLGAVSEAGKKKRSEPCTYLMTQNWRLRNKMSIGFRAGTGLSSSNSYKEDGVAQEWGCRWGAEEVRGNRVRLDYAGHWPSEWGLGPAALASLEMQSLRPQLSTSRNGHPEGGGPAMWGSHCRALNREVAQSNGDHCVWPCL